VLGNNSATTSECVLGVGQCKALWEGCQCYWLG